MEERKLVSGEYLEYKGRPLVREGDTICYGDMEEKGILLLEIMSYKKNEQGVSVPDDIMIQVVESKNQNNILRQGHKKGLSEAFGLGLVWLEHECKK